MRQLSSLLALCLSAAPAPAQQYVIDQSSPYDNVDYNGSLGGGWVWEQQIRTGISGQLAGIELQVRSIVPNDLMTVEIVDGALGAGGAVLWHGSVGPTALNVRQKVKVNLLAANIVRSAQDLFIIRIVADGAGMDFTGNAYFPNASYPEEFWANGQPAGGTERLGFKTYVSNGPLLRIGGSCPGPLTLTVDDATAGGGVALLTGVPGSYTRNGQPCPGLTIGIAQPHYVGIITANGLGTASLNFTAPPGLCGRSVAAVDLATCAATNTVIL